MSIQLFAHNEEDLRKAAKLIIDETVRRFGLNDQNTKPKQNLVNNKEIAEFLGISLGTLISWRKAGKIPYRKFGRTPLYSKDEVLQALHFQESENACDSEKEVENQSNN